MILLSDMGGLNYQIIIVIGVVLFLLISMYKDFFRPVIAFAIAVSLLLIFRIIDVKDALAGFSNEQIAVIFLVLMLGDVIKETSLLDVVSKKLFNLSLSYRAFLARMMFSVSGVSAFVNNTPIVAIMIPYIYDWARKKKISPSKVMMHLSYATMLGGTVTLVGTSTNLVVNGLAVEAGLKPLGMFAFTPIGIPLVIVGNLYLLFIAHKLLPDRKDAMANFAEKSREYVVETYIPQSSSLIGKTVEQANLRNLRGLFLVEIIRDGKQIAPVAPTEVMEQGDELIFAGETETIVDLVNSSKDLALPREHFDPGKDGLNIIEAIVSPNSNLTGKIVKEANFRGNYDAAIIAINRNGERISGKLGEVELNTGDLLLLVEGKDFKKVIQESPDMYVISTVKEINHINNWKLGLFLLGIVSAFVLPAMGVAPLFLTLLILLALVPVLNIVKVSAVKKNIDINLISILALSLAIGKAISKSGADKIFADMILGAVEPIGSTIAVLFGICIITNILAMFVTNKAAVAITFPIAYALVGKLGLSDPTPFVLAVAFAGSCEFITPYGYQTNLMVMGPGGYKFKDYVKVGVWLSLLYMIVAVLGLGYRYNLL